MTCVYGKHHYIVAIDCVLYLVGFIMCLSDSLFAQLGVYLTGLLSTLLTQYEFTLNELAHGLLYMIVSAIMITIIMHMKTNNFDSSHLVYWKDLKQLVSSYIHADFQYSLLCRSLVG